MVELWKDITWYEWTYQISNFWKVRSFRGNVIRWNLTKWYLKFQLSLKWVVKTKTCHRLVAEHFIENPENKKCVNHIDGNKLNNRADNLEWATYSENNQHAYDTWLKNPYQIGLLWASAPRAKPVAQCDMEWNVIKEWWSVVDVMRAIWIHRNSIHNSMAGRSKTAWGFVWKYL